MKQLDWIRTPTPMRTSLSTPVPRPITDSAPDEAVLAHLCLVADHGVVPDPGARVDHGTGADRAAGLHDQGLQLTDRGARVAAEPRALAQDSPVLHLAARTDLRSAVDHHAGADLGVVGDRDVVARASAQARGRKGERSASGAAPRKCLRDAALVQGALQALEDPHGAHRALGAGLRLGAGADALDEMPALDAQRLLVRICAGS